MASSSLESTRPHSRRDLRRSSRSRDTRLHHDDADYGEEESTPLKEFCFESGFHYQSGSHHSSHPGLWAWTAYVDSGLKFTGHVWPLV